MERERKRERAKEKSEVRLLAIFLLLFFSNRVKKLHFNMAVFIFCFSLESL